MGQTPVPVCTGNSFSEVVIHFYVFDSCLLEYMLLPQNPNVAISTPNFTIGSSRNCNFPLKDHTISGNLCKIKHTQVYLRTNVRFCDGGFGRLWLCVIWLLVRLLQAHTSVLLDHFTWLLFDMFLGPILEVYAWLPSFPPFFFPVVWGEYLRYVCAVWLLLFLEMISAREAPWLC